MSFVFLDAKTHDFIDIVEGRTKYILNSYFLRFKRKTKNKVKKITSLILPTMMTTSLTSWSPWTGRNPLNCFSATG